MIRIILIIALFFLQNSCTDSSDVVTKDKSYLLAYGSHNGLGIMELNIFNNVEKIIANKLYLQGVHNSSHIYSIDKNRFLFGSLEKGVVLYDKEENKVIYKNKKIHLYGFLDKYKLFLGQIYHNGISILKLYDLEFNEKATITDHAFQFNNITLNNKYIVFSKDVKRWELKNDEETYNQLWLYDLKTNKKNRLNELEKYCHSILGYREKTNELICKDNFGIMLFNFNTNTKKYINLDRRSKILLYDIDMDAVFVAVTVSKWILQEQRNLELYFFESEKSKIIKENIIVYGMDIEKK